MTCIFCSEHLRVLHDTDLWKVVVDAFPVAPGHVTIVPHHHVESIFDLNPNEWLQLQYLLNKIPQLLQETDFSQVYSEMTGTVGEKSDTFLREARQQLQTMGEVQGFNIGTNEGREAGRTVDHVHIHVIPRYHEDGSNHGIRHIFSRGSYVD